MVELLRYVLTMLGKRTALLDSGGGLATHRAKAERPTDLLFAVPERDHTFSRSLAAPMWLAQALCVAMAGLQQGDTPRIPVALGP